MKVVIIAAGMGNRLWNQTEKIPKSLLKFQNSTILSTIINNFVKTKINDFIIITGYNSDYIHNYINNLNKKNINIELIHNNRWNKGNAISVLSAKEKISNETFILSMSDHLISTTALERIISTESKENLLLVDPQIDKVFDIDDATKVRVENNYLVDIGKTIHKYNSIDCGIFKLKPSVFPAIEMALTYNKDSISEAVKILIQNKDIKAVFTKPDERWIDIDTPESYEYLKSKLYIYFK